MARSELSRRARRGWRRLAGGLAASVLALAAIAEPPSEPLSADDAAQALAKACGEINADSRLNQYQKDNVTDALQCAGVTVEPAAFAKNLPMQQAGLCAALSQLCAAGGVVGGVYANPLSTRLACGAAQAPRCNASAGSAGVVFLDLPAECEAIGLRHAAALVGRPSTGPYISLLLASDDGREVNGALEPTLSPDPDASDLKARLEAAVSTICFDIHRKSASDAAGMQAIARMTWPTPAGGLALTTLRSAMGLDRPAGPQQAGPSASIPAAALSDDATLADEPAASLPPPAAAAAPSAAAPSAAAQDEPRLTDPVPPPPEPETGGPDTPLSPDAPLADDEGQPAGAGDGGVIARALRQAQEWRDGMIDQACGDDDAKFRELCFNTLKATYQSALEDWRASDEPVQKKVERLKAYLQERLDQALAYLRKQSDRVAKPDSQP